MEFIVERLFWRDKQNISFDTAHACNNMYTYTSNTGIVRLKTFALHLPVCVLLCIFKFSDLANTFPQLGNGHGNGFSPVCTLIWFTNLYLALKGLPFLGHPCQKHACVVHSGPPT